MPGVPTKVRWLFFSLNAGNGAAIGTLAHLGQSTTADILPAANLQWPLLNPNNLPECADFYDLTQIFAYITASSILSVTAGV